MKILLIGVQGSGKSTQASLLSDFLNIPVISTGDIFRSLSDQDTEEARRMKQILDEGKLVDDETTSKKTLARLKQPDCKDGFIMDGYPRTLKQIEYFDPGFDKVFYLKLSDEDATKRLIARGRADDTPAAVVERLRIYHKETDPILDYYHNKGLVKEIDGRGMIEQIQQKIREELNG